MVIALRCHTIGPSIELGIIMFLVLWVRGPSPDLGKILLTFHYLGVDKMSTKRAWELSIEGCALE